MREYFVDHLECIIEKLNLFRNVKILLSFIHAKAVCGGGLKPPKFLTVEMQVWPGMHSCIYLHIMIFLIREIKTNNLLINTKHIDQKV